MLIRVTPQVSWSVLSGPVPSHLKAVLDAASNGKSIESPVQATIAPWGFSNFVFGFSTAPTRRRDSRFYICSNAPAAWVAEYDREAYIEIDPRLAHTWTNLTPIIWDRRIGAGKAVVDAFLDRAATSGGIGSGVCIGLRGESNSHSMLALNASSRDVDDALVSRWSDIMGDITLMAAHLHAIFLRNVFQYGLGPRQTGAPLSPREQECLQLCSNGQTGPDIATKLGIAERTVQFHFSNIMSKLGAANRQEAIAIAVTTGAIQT